MADITRKSLLPLLLSAAAVAQIAQTLPEDRRAGAASVSEAQVRKWLGTLASPEFEGRGTGQDGFQKAAEYVRDHFQALGLKPGADNGTFFQKVPWAGSKVDEQSAVTFRKGEASVTVPAARLGGAISKTLAAKGKAVLLTTVDADDIEPLDLKDRIVVLLIEGDGRTVLNAARALQGKEAAALLIAQKAAVEGRLTGRAGMGRGGNRAAEAARNVPASIQFGGSDLEAVLKLAGIDAAADKAPLRELGLDVDVNITVVETDLPAMNVVAVLPGGDPQLQKEYVVIGSHLDHLGRRGNRIFPGADDDASGTTGVMAVAAMLAGSPQKLPRSVLLVCFCGEENGLVGSRFFVANPPIPLASIVGELQMDMIGRDEEENAEGDQGERAEQNRNCLHLIGSQKLSPALHELCMQKNVAAQFDLEWDQEGMFGRSDHANFARMGVPIAFFFTGLHRDYHQASDTPDKINYPKLLRVATYVYDIAFELGAQAGRPLVDPQLWAGYRGKGSAEPAAPMATGEAAKETKEPGKEPAKEPGKEPAKDTPRRTSGGG